MLMSSFQISGNADLIYIYMKWGSFYFQAMRIENYKSLSDNFMSLYIFTFLY